MSITKPRYWASPAPITCDLCSDLIEDKFIDGRTRMGPWGCMCPTCHRRNGVGLGTGNGQEYTKQEDGKWLKTGG